MQEDITTQQALTGALQENILTLLCFDDDSAGIITNLVQPGLFESDIYKEVARQAINYYQQFRLAPKEHLPDILESLLNDKANPRKSELYRKVLINLYEFKDSVNSKYVLTQLSTFIREQRWKEALVDAVQLARDGKWDDSQNTAQKALNTQIDIFKPGVAFAKDLTKSLSFFDQLGNTYATGIAPLDKLGIGPAPGQLLVILAPPNRGKSMMLVHLGKYATLQRLKVLYISLEMSEEIVSQRFVQSLFAFAKRKSESRYMSFQLDEMGRFMDLKLEQIEVPTLIQPDAQEKVSKKLVRYQNRIKLYIKRFPTGGLSLAGLEAYLDGMERLYHFKPDMILLDYADLMQLDSRQLRVDTGSLYKDLRRIAVERDLAIVTASQSNRLAEDARVITLKHFAEDYSKAATADDVWAYCQTQSELKLGLARIYVAKARNEERGQQVLVSQCYNMAQFAINATLMDSNHYWTSVDRLTGDSRESDSDEEQQSGTRGRQRYRAANQ